MKKPKYCTKCGKKIPKSEALAYFKAKRVCQECYERRNNKSIRSKSTWWSL